jgi:hypothetical protein
LSLRKIDKSGESMKSYCPAFLRILLGTVKVQAPTILHFKGLARINLISNEKKPKTS